MKRSKKRYKRPKKLWDKERIEKDKELKKKFGLVRAHEIWIAETLLRKYRRLARRLVATRDKEAEKILIGKLVKIGILDKGAKLEDVLGLNEEDMLERRLQTVVFKRGLVNTPMQARQAIAHGHVRINGRRSTSPSRLVLKEEEAKIEVSQKINKGA